MFDKLGKQLAKGTKRLYTGLMALPQVVCAAMLVAFAHVALTMVWDMGAADFIAE